MPLACCQVDECFAALNWEEERSVVPIVFLLRCNTAFYSYDLNFEHSPHAGLPDGIFTYQKYQYLYIFGGLGMEKNGLFMAIWYFCVHFGIFFPVLVCFTKKNLATICS
jgi:hypothetical protein